MSTRFQPVRPPCDEPGGGTRTNAEPIDSGEPEVGPAEADAPGGADHDEAAQGDKAQPGEEEAGVAPR